VRSVVVEGAHVGTRRDDAPENAFHILEHVACRNPHEPKALTSEQRVASSISSRLVSE